MISLLVHTNITVVSIADRQTKLALVAFSAFQHYIYPLRTQLKHQRYHFFFIFHISLINNSSTGNFEHELVWCNVAAGL